MNEVRPDSLGTKPDEKGKLPENIDGKWILGNERTRIGQMGRREDGRGG